MNNDTPLRILHLEHTGAPGGGQLGLARYLEHSPAGHHGVIFLTGGPIVDRIRATGAPVAVRLPDAPFAGKRDLFVSQRWLLHAIRRFEPDVIVANSAAAAKAFAPLIPWIDAVTVYYMRTDLSVQSMGLFKNKLMTNVYYRHFDALLANSTWTRDSRPAELRSKPVEIAYPVSGNQADANATPDRPERRTPDGRRIFSVISLSRFDPWKGQLHLLEAADLAQKALADDGIQITVDLFGGGVLSDPAYADQLAAMARQITPAVQLHGHVSDVNERLDRADCLVLSSVLPEPFGQVVVQSLSRGALTIVPNEGGPNDVVVDGRSGLTYPAGDTSALKDLLVRAAREPEWRRRLATKGLVRAKDFTDAATVDGLTQAIERVHEAVCG